MSRCIIIMLCAAFLIACEDPIKVQLSNKSGSMLSDIIIRAKGDSIGIKSLQNGKVGNASLCPTGDASVQISFLVGDRTVNKDIGGYWTGGLKCKYYVTIDTLFDVVLDSLLTKGIIP